VLSSRRQRQRVILAAVKGLRRPCPATRWTASARSRARAPRPRGPSAPRPSRDST